MSTCVSIAPNVNMSGGESSIRDGETINREELSSLKVIVDIYTNISTAHGLLHFKCDQKVSHIRITIHNDAIVISIVKDNCTVHELKLLSSPGSFYPLSFQSHTPYTTRVLKAKEEYITVEFDAQLLFPNGEIHIPFRCQVNNEHIRPGPALIKNNDYTSQLEINVPYKVTCKMCSGELCAEDVIFKKISAVDADQTELREISFCHKSKESCSSFIQQVDELFYTTNLCILRCLSKDRLSQSGTCINCRNCKALLSTVKRNDLFATNCPIPCFKDKILFSSRNGKLNRHEPNGTVCLSILLGIINKTLATSVTCKLYLDAKMPNSEEKCLLLWVITPNMHSYYTEQNIFGLNVTEALDLQTVMKVLFYESTPDSSIARSWRHQFSTDYYHISDLMMQEITGLLHKRSFLYGHSEGTLQDFRTGYIPVVL